MNDCARGATRELRPRERSLVTTQYNDQRRVHVYRATCNTHRRGAAHCLSRNTCNGRLLMCCTVTVLLTKLVEANGV